MTYQAAKIAAILIPFGPTLAEHRSKEIDAIMRLRVPWELKLQGIRAVLSRHDEDGRVPTDDLNNMTLLCAREWEAASK